MIFKTVKPGVNQKYSLANPNLPCVNLFSPYANPTILEIPKSLAKSSRDTPYICVLITCPIFLVQSVDVTFWGRTSFHLPRKCLHGLHWFAPQWRVNRPCFRRKKSFAVYLRDAFGHHNLRNNSILNLLFDSMQ